MLRAVLDANVYVSALLRPDGPSGQIIETFLRDATFEIILSPADFVAGDLELAGVSDDPDDDKYIAAAVEGRAAFVVTGDQDLLDVGEYEGIRIVSPRAFLNLLSA